MTNDTLPWKLWLVLAGMALLGVLCGCGEEPWKTRSGWQHEGVLTAIPPGVEEVLQAAGELAPCLVEPWGGWVEWYDGPFSCGGVPAGGCYREVREARVQVVGLPYRQEALTTALAHELGHYVEDRCFGSTTERGADAFAAEVYRYLRPTDAP